MRNACLTYPGSGKNLFHVHELYVSHTKTLGLTYVIQADDVREARRECLQNRLLVACIYIKVAALTPNSYGNWLLT